MKHGGFWHIIGHAHPGGRAPGGLVCVAQHRGHPGDFLAACDARECIRCAVIESYETRRVAGLEMVFIKIGVGALMVPK